jgi:hypothetical protein
VISLLNCRGLSPVNGAVQDGSDAVITPATPRSSQDDQGASVEPTDWRRMMEHDEALQLAATFLDAGQRDDEPPLAIDTERVRENNGLLIVSYNSAQYLASRV